MTSDLATELRRVAERMRREGWAANAAVVDHAAAVVERQEKGLRDIMRHQVEIGGGLARYSAPYYIAEAALSTQEQEPRP